MEKKFCREIIFVLLAGGISALTALVPIYLAVPKIIYANNIPTALIAIEFGPFWGAIYAVLASYVLNSFGMGSGVLLNTLMASILEALMIGILLSWKNSGKKGAGLIIRVVFAAAVSAILIKPIAYLFYYIFNYSTMEKSCIAYMSDNLNFYVKNSLLSNFEVSLFSLAAAVLICICVHKLFDPKKNNHK